MHVSFKLSASFAFSFVIVLIFSNTIQRNPLFVLCIMAINGFALLLMQSKLKHFFHVVKSLEEFSESLTAAIKVGHYRKVHIKVLIYISILQQNWTNVFQLPPSPRKTQRKEPEIHNWARVVKFKTMYTSSAPLKQWFKCGVFCSFIFIHPGWIQKKSSTLTRIFTVDMDISDEMKSYIRNNWFWQMSMFFVFELIFFQYLYKVSC